jgi:two-component sensor histidine kinase
MSPYPPAVRLIVMAVFVGIGLLSGTANIVLSGARGQPVDAAGVMGHALFVWLLFGVLALLVLWTARRFPLEPGRIARHLPAHLATLVGMSFTHTTVYTIVMTTVVKGAPGLAAPANLLGNLRADVFVYALVVGIYYLYAYAVRYRERERAAADLELRSSQLEAALARARLDALTAQLQPHFLFNTLNSISTLILKQENEPARRMLHRLADLLRATLAATGEQMVTLQRELELVQRYFDIEAVRFPDRLRPSIRVAPDLLQARVPALLLQPLVENAIRHGVAAVPTAGRVEVRATRLNGTLRIEVCDDGLGPADAAGAEGVGLANTRQRLAQLYGERGLLSLERSALGGAVTRVEIPL